MPALDVHTKVTWPWLGMLKWNFLFCPKAANSKVKILLFILHKNHQAYFQFRPQFSTDNFDIGPKWICLQAVMTVSKKLSSFPWLNTPAKKKIWKIKLFFPFRLSEKMVSFLFEWLCTRDSLTLREQKKFDDFSASVFFVFLGNDFSSPGRNKMSQEEKKLWPPKKCMTLN